MFFTSSGHVQVRSTVALCCEDTVRTGPLHGTPALPAELMGTLDFIFSRASQGLRTATFCILTHYNRCLPLACGQRLNI